MIIAHILGVPVEELFMPLAGGGVGTGILLVIASRIGIRNAYPRQKRN